MSSAAYFLLWAMCYTSVLNVNSSQLRISNETDSDTYIYEKYVELDKSLKNLVNYGVKLALPFIMEGNENVNLSSTCSNDLFHLLSEIRKLKYSAFQFLDSFGKPPDAFFSGNFHMLGAYDQCMHTTVTRKNGSIAFKGQYCLLFIKTLLPTKPPTTEADTGIEGLIKATANASEVIQNLASGAHVFYYFPPKLGVCVPSGCSYEDIDSLLKYVMKKVPILNATVAYCDKYYDNPTSTGKIIAVFFYALFGLLAIAGSSVDFYSKKKDVKFQNLGAKLLQCFSVQSNFQKLMNLKTNEKSLSSLFGIRSLSVFYIILTHQYFFAQKFNALGHFRSFQHAGSQFFFQIILNGWLTTDIFIFVGGLVNSYARLNFMKTNNRQVGKIILIVRRLWRIYPAYLICMLSVYLLNDGHGPLRTLTKQLYWENCDKNWWLNLLFINNFIEQEKSCFLHGWYMAVDMQLFLMSLFTVPVFFKNPKRGILLHLGIILVGLTSTTLWAWHKKILVRVNHMNKDEVNNIWQVYTTTFPHIAPYFAGLLTGYVLLVHKDLKIPTFYQVTGWSAAGTAFISMLFMTTRWNSGEEVNAVESYLYFAFSRLIYPLSVGWMVLCCARGYGGVLNYILSLKVWIPLARISYMMFLISPLLQVSYISNLRMILDTIQMVMIWQYMGDLAISFLAALALSTVFEAPFFALEKIIFRRKLTQETEKTDDKNVAVVNNVAVEKELDTYELQNGNKNGIIDIQFKQ